MKPCKKLEDAQAMKAMVETIIDNMIYGPQWTAEQLVSLYMDMGMDEYQIAEKLLKDAFAEYFAIRRWKCRKIEKEGDG